MKFDMHVHTILSKCSQLSIPELLSTARDKGLDGVCITDHNSMAAAGEIHEGVQDDGLCVIIGMEYATPDGDFLIFGPFENIEPGLSGRELLDLVDKREGAAIVAHPFRQGRSVDEELIRAGLCDIIEGVNGRNQRQENELACQWREKYQLRLASGSDAHSLDELGKSPLMFTERITCRTEMIKALRHGKFQPPAPPPQP